MSETVLIVDCLSDAGYALMVAEDGEEALAQTTQRVPDLILLDVMMPGLDGFETCRRLKAAPATRDVPVLFMTALTETADKVKAFAAGAVDYITKPIQHEEALARVRTHLSLRRLRRELEEQLALKEKFQRIASHDLRNPLCLVLMASEVARRQPDLTPAASEFLQTVHTSATQMRRIIDTFLDLRKSDGTGRIDLALVATAVVRQHDLAAERKAIALIYEDSAAPLPPVRCEAAHAYQALTNYVSNALKFTPCGGRVTVRTRLAGARVRVEVSDTGPGVPEAERAQLFTDYARLSPRPTAGEESHGLGLAIVKNLIASQSGQTGAEFPTTGGSTFWLELPIAGM